ncbi:MAG TPA: hypothetical protein VH207_17085 [Chthoniobacterales bacterium]|nr:hypothetical protein [Chthoniobacterales bacterium]
MRKILGTLLFLLVLPPARAAVINVEFKFTPFVGDPTKDEKVTTVPGKAAIFINDVPFAEQEVQDNEVPVLFDEHEVAQAVWVPMSSVGPAVRKGKNKLRIEFTPNDAAKPYRAQLRWASVTDSTTTEEEPGSMRSTNQAGEGVDDRKNLKGKAIFEREFTADFAQDLPWQHYPPVTSLTEEDKQKIVALLKNRADWFKPDFSALYKAIDQNESLKVDDVRKAQCLEAVYKAGVRVNAPEVGDLKFATTKGPEVVVTPRDATSRNLFGLDENSLAAVKDEDTQMCAGMVLAMIYPGKLVAVRKADGGWEIVY